MASVAANIIQTPVQPNAAAQGTSNPADSAGADGGFAAILANLSAGDDAQQGAAQPANDAVSGAGNTAAIPDNGAQTPVNAAPDAANILPDTVASLVQTASPQKPDASATNGKPANDADDSAAGDQPASRNNTATGDNSVLAALLLQQPAQTSAKPVSVNMDSDKGSAPVDASAPSIAAASDADQATQGSKDAKTAPDAAKLKAANADMRAKADKIELPKAFAQDLSETKPAPLTPDSKDSKPEPANANGKQSGAEQHSQDRQPASHEAQAQTDSRIDAPQNIANNNTPDAQPVQAAAAKTDAPPQLPVNIAAIAAPNAPAASVPNTAATLHSVSALRDAAPDLHTMAVQISSFSAQDIKHFQIRMDPPELGRVEVHLTVDDAGKTQATMMVEKPHALEMLQKDSPALERALKDAGIDLSNNGLNFSLKGQDRQQDGGARANGKTRSSNLAANARIDGITAANTNILASGNTGLDIRV